jgi:drug/metabolite transporter (DMT)-like permease
MPTPRHRSQRGFLLALLTAFAWGLLPIAMALLVKHLTPFTITWWRLAGSAAMLAIWLAVRGALPRLDRHLLRSLPWLGVALAGLVGNYLCYSASLQHTTPSVSQIVIQLAPMLLLLAGLWFFHERLSRIQAFGLGILFIGLALFFNHRLPELIRPHGELSTGVALVVLSSILWASYGIAQKKLLARLTPPQILLLLFIAGMLVLWPLSRPAAALQLDLTGRLVLLFAVANTVIGYLSFAEAMAAWEISRVSALVSVGPVFTLASMALLERWLPGTLPPEGLNYLSVTGALLVIGGSVTCALGAAARPGTKPAR